MSKATFRGNHRVWRLVYAGICLALALVLPFLTGQLQQIGNALCPMHIPVLLCGFLCGWPWGLAVGFVAPLLRFLLFSMPPIYPIGIAMAFELATYGLLAGLLYRRLPKTVPNMYVSLIVAMVGGRLVWGAARLLLAGLGGTAFPFSAFLAGAVTTALPGIAIQILFIPLIVLALRRARLLPDQER